MRRRTFLALTSAGLAAGTAGCSGIGGTGDDGTTATETETETNPDTPSNATDTATAAPTTTAAEPTTMNGETTATTTGQPATLTGTTGDDGGSSGGGGDSSGVSGKVTSVPDGLEITERRFYSMQFSTGVRGILKNVSGSPFEYVEVRATFYDSQGTRLDTGIDYDAGLAAGAEWPFDVVYRGSRDPSQIARYTLMVDTSPF